MADKKDSPDLNLETRIEQLEARIKILEEITGSLLEPLVTENLNMFGGDPVKCNHDWNKDKICRKCFTILLEYPET